MQSMTLFVVVATSSAAYSTFWIWESHLLKSISLWVSLIMGAPAFFPSSDI